MTIWRMPEWITDHCWFVISIWTTLRIIFIFVFMYFFVCSLNLLSDAFRLITGAKLGQLLKQNSLVQNPIIDLMIGILVTMTVHSSATTRTMVISMTSANVIPLDNAIYILHGAEIGCSITNIIFSFGLITDRENFSRAFSCAALSGVFNWLTVLMCFPLETGTHVFRRLAELMVENIKPQYNAQTDKEFLNTLIKALTSKIIQLDQHLLDDLASFQIDETNFTTLIKSNGDFIFNSTYLSDISIGIILIVCSLTCLFICLIGLAKTMNSLLTSEVGQVIQAFINSDLPGKWKPLTGYIFILIGTSTTALIQSSTIFTSLLTPMLAIGVISVERVFPLILGANIGAALDNILDAFAQEPNIVKMALSIALWQIMFNISGVLIFYSIPFLHQMVIDIVKWFGWITLEYGWFPFVYVCLLFILFPLGCIGLLLTGTLVTCSLAISLTVFILLIIILTILQRHNPSVLPSKLRNWNLLAWCR